MKKSLIALFSLSFVSGAVPAEAQFLFRFNTNINMPVPSFMAHSISIPDLYVGEPVSSLQVTATGGIGKITWSASGSLPSGLDFSSEGVLSGTPASAGTHEDIYFIAEDTLDRTTSIGPNDLRVYAPVEGGVFHRIMLLGVGVNEPLPVNGGKSPLTFTIVSGELPPGLTISGARLVGIPQTEGQFHADILVTDSNGRSSNVDVAITTTTALVATASFPDAYVNEAYTSGQFSANGGILPYSWFIETGAIPNGLSLDAETGRVTGTISSAGTYNFIGRVTDGWSFSSVSANLNAYNLPTINEKNYPDPYIGTAYTAADGAHPSISGGKPNYSWTATGLPVGMTINAATGIISGAPTTTTATTATITVADANAKTASRTYSFTPRSALAISNAPATAMNRTTAVSTTIVGTGGKTPYSWSATGLPTGLSINATTGLISGTPTANGTYNAVVKVTDANSKSATRTTAISVTSGNYTVALPGGNGAVNLQNLFTAAQWSSDIPKIVDLAAGQVRGSTSPSPVVSIGAAWGGSLTFNVAGQIQGASGAANGGEGGMAFNANTKGTSGQNIQLVVTGHILAGGGGGGAGGRGGKGGDGSTQHGGADGAFYPTFGGSGGAGGNGGVGVGYGVARTDGLAGTAGFNGSGGGAGKGGTGGNGGNGGDWGAAGLAGTKGSTGSIGVYAEGGTSAGSPGANGTPGGLGGVAINGIANVSLTGSNVFGRRQ